MNGYFRFGLIMSFIVLLLFAILAFGPVQVEGQSEVPRWKDFWYAPPNEIGDTIAGLAGTLAFLWIIVTVMIQGSELRLQRRELAMTRRELRAQREASEKMATAQESQAAQLAKQVEILDYQLTSLKHRDVKSHLDQIVGTIVRDLRSLSELAHWEVHGRGVSVDVSGERTETATISKCGMFSFNSGDTESLIRQAILGVNHFKTRISVTKDIAPRHGKKSAARPQVIEILNSIDSALELDASLSPPDSQWLQSLHLDDLREALASLSEMDLWDQSGHYGYVVAIQ